MKKTFSVLSVISFMLYALVDFGKNVIETYLHVELINGMVSFAESDYLIDTQRCQSVLMIIGIVCFILFVISFFFEKTDNQ